MTFLPFRCCALAAIALFCCGAYAQQGAASSQGVDRAIHLSVVVTTKRGEVVGGLSRQDFTVFDNKTERPITSFRAVSAGQEPVEVILAIDSVNTPYTVITYARQQIDNFLRANGGHLAQPTTLAIVTDTGTKVQDTFTTDGGALSTTLDRQTIALRFLTRSTGLAGASDRFEISLGALRALAAREAKQPGRKLILWISPGWPLLSGPGIELSSGQQRAIFSDIVGVSTELRQDRTTLYSIDPLGAGEGIEAASYYQDFLKGIAKPGQDEIADLGLQVLATQSGGLALYGSNNVVGFLQKSVDDAKDWYEISFDAAPSEHRDEYHAIDVRVDKPGLTVRTRQGYYAQP